MQKKKTRTRGRHMSPKCNKQGEKTTAETENERQIKG